MEREGTNKDSWALVDTDSKKDTVFPLGWWKDDEDLTVDSTDFKMTWAKKGLENMLSDFTVPNRQKLQMAEN